MKKTIPALLSLFSFLLLSVTSNAQTGFTGTIRDSSENKFLKNVVVSLLKTSDSVLVKYIRTGENGKFVLDKIPPGKYIIDVSFPGYANYVDIVETSSNELVNLSTINIIPKAKLLEEIVIQQKVAAIRIKGDTTEFKADSFKVGPNANVQELLKRLPGLQVNSKGEITAQGQKVQKVLVDGEEFFSDDPAVVTENLRADLVDKVQVFDKKSEQTEFTGVDDGEKTKTINLTLKEDKKKGYFGKVEAGSDFAKYRNEKAMINSFKKKQKITAYASHNNINFNSLDWDERRNYGSSGSGFEVMDDGGLMMMMGNYNEFTYGSGLPVSTAGGFGYANKWKNDKHSINGNYQFNDQIAKGINTSFRKTILKDSSFSNYTTENFNTTGQRNYVNGIYEWRIDSNNTVKIKADGTLTKRANINNYTGHAVSDDDKTLNNITRTTTNNNESKVFNSEISWRKKFKKQGRTFSYYGNLGNNYNEGFVFLNSATNFFDENEQIIQSQIIDQKKVNHSAYSYVLNRMFFTEGLSKKFFLELNYSNAFNNNNAERVTYEKGNGSSDYKTRIDTLSNHLIYNTNNHTGGISFRFTDKKLNINIGNKIGKTAYRLREINKGYNNNISFTNFLPSININYSPKKQKWYHFSYNGSTNNPSLQQINPMIDNIDPLNITIGNPNLKQSFIHYLRASVAEYKILKSQNFNITVSLSLIRNAITSSSLVERGKTINQSVNVNGTYNSSIWATYGFEVAPSLFLSFELSSNINRNINFVNHIQNITNSHRSSLTAGISRWRDKVLNFRIRFAPGLNYSKSTINPLKNQYWEFGASPWVGLNFKKNKLVISTEAEIYLYQQNNVFKSPQNRTIIKATVQKSFTKKEALAVKVSVNDLLNQNTSVNRYIGNNFISETTNQNIQRYYMLALVWNFTKNGKPSN